MSNKIIVLGNIMDPLNINYSNYRVYSGGVLHRPLVLVASVRIG